MGLLGTWVRKVDFELRASLSAFDGKHCCIIIVKDMDCGRMKQSAINVKCYGAKVVEQRKLWLRRNSNCDAVMESGF